MPFEGSSKRTMIASQLFAVVALVAVVTAQQTAYGQCGGNGALNVRHACSISILMSSQDGEFYPLVVTVPLLTFRCNQDGSYHVR